jgi:hypothetical protein
MNCYRATTTQLTCSSQVANCVCIAAVNPLPEHLHSPDGTGSGPRAFVFAPISLASFLTHLIADQLVKINKRVAMLDHGK